MNQNAAISVLQKIADKIGALVFSIGGDPKDYVCHVRLSSTTVSIASGSSVVVPFDNKNFDPENCFDFVNRRFVAPVAGYYQVSGAVQYATAGNAGQYAFCSIYKNGSGLFRGSNKKMQTGDVIISFVGATVYLEKGDYVDIRTYQDTGAVQTLQGVGGGGYYCHLTVAKINKYSGGSSQPTGEAWQSVTAFFNSWVNFGGSPALWNDAQFFKDTNGVVHIRGLVKSGTVGTTPATCKAFVLPEGYRPARQELFVVNSNSVFGNVVVYPTGEVVMYAGNNSFFFLDGITFRANGY